MTTINLEKDTLTMRELVKLLRAGPIVIAEHNQPVMTVVAVDEDEVESWELGHSAEVMAIVEQSRHELREGGGLSLDEMRAALDLPTGASEK